MTDPNPLNIADGPDPDRAEVQPDPPDIIAEVERLAADADAGRQGDWDLRGNT